MWYIARKTQPRDDYLVVMWHAERIANTRGSKIVCLSHVFIDGGRDSTIETGDGLGRFRLPYDLEPV